MGGTIRLLICGSRGWKDRQAIEAVIEGYYTIAEDLGETLTVIHGDAPKGADRIADHIARLNPDIEVIREPADWKTYGKGAGPVRNQKMLDDHKPDVVYAFRTYGKSNGTDDMVERAQNAHVTNYTVTGGEHPM